MLCHRVMFFCNSAIKKRSFSVGQASCERKKTSYSRNVTAGLGLTGIWKQFLDDFEPRIIEHAARRVDLFFYSVIAVYDRQVMVSRGQTVKQHGRGSFIRATHACHSSLFPHLILQKKSDLTGESRRDTTLDDTHFADSLNMTTELPIIVNKFDSYLDGTNKTSVLHDAATILNDAAIGKIEPKAAMNQFFSVMARFFTNFEKNHAKSDLKKVAAWQKSGTFLAANVDNTVREDYLHLMLRLHPHEKLEVQADPDRWYFYYKRIQDEIYLSKAVKRLK